jgi:fructosamine-3-kinase
VSPDPALRSLETAIADATRTGFEISSTSPVAGGCIHHALRLSGETAKGKQDYFAKVNEPGRAAMFTREAEGLAALRSAGALRVPAVIAKGHDEDRAWLVLEWLDLAPLEAKSAARLGASLAAQHRLPQETFGWARDNFIGATPQLNGASDDWLAFWRSNRLHAQLRLAAHHRLPSRMIDRGERLMADCGAFYRTYAPAKSLLHGDLWGGNAAAIAGGTPVVFDPAVYVGDREADVAMTELFGGFPGDFLSAYRASWPLDDGYRVRRDLYNLYHRLNHANLFGGGYVRESEQAIERLLAEIA